MNPIRRGHAALFVTVAALALSGQAQAQTGAQAGAPAKPGCKGGDAAPLAVGTVAAVAPGAARTYALDLGPREGVIVDLSSLAPRPEGSDDDDGEDAPQGPPQGLKLCDAQGNVLAPQPGDVFTKGGSVTATDEGLRLRFYANAAGRYLLSVAADAAPREILVRRREGGTVQQPVIAARLGAAQKGTASSSAPMVFSFSGPAGQWVEIKSTSENDTLLRLAAPDRDGNYAVVAENDDSDGLNPVIRRRLPVAGPYFVQVDSLSDDAAPFELTLNRIDPPAPPPPPAPLRPGAAVAGRLADGDAVAVYALPVAAGHGYRLELTAAYDGVVAIGVPNPVEPEDGGADADAGFTEIKSQDAGTSGTEKLTFTARGNGQVLVRIKSFGIGETDGAFTLKAVDLGG